MKMCHKMWFLWVFLAGISSIFCMELVEELRRDSKNQGNTECGPNECDHCIGTKNGRSKTTPDPNKPYNHYNQLKNLFINCKRIIGNLEITHIDKGQLIDDDEENFTTENGTIALRKKKPFWFLEHLEQISGYLLIFLVDVERIDLPNLRIIWGRKLIDNHYSFSVESSRLKFLNMPKFRSIENGKVNMRSLPKLCYAKNINFYELLGKHSKHKVHSHGVSTDVSCANALECDPGCNGFCYGPEPGMCQDVYRHHCSSNCASGMCLKNATGEETCCDERCTAGCYGTGAAHCVGCKDFEQDGVCVDRCRGIYRYDPITRRQTELPDEEKRYTFEKHCDNKCPTDTLIEGENCVERCSDGFYQEPSNPKKECIVCKGACPKECFLNETINAENIGNLTNCTRINGNIVILTHVWKARQYEKDGPIIPALKAEDLYALKDITFVSGFVNIEGGFISPPKSLDFLSNLEYIGGRGNHHGYTLQILANSEIEYLGLKSLKQITSGHVVIKLNANLCYGYTINWKKFMTKDFNIIYERNTPNHTCVDKGRICNETCVQEEGCWGPGPKMCVQCKNFIKDDECANHCPIENGYFIEKASRNESDAIEENVNAPQKCERCYKNCKKCEGSGEENCTECLPHAFVLQIPTQNNSFCVDKCPENYTYPVGNTCVNCHEACLPYGCTGPDSHVGTGGCNKCQYGVTEGDQVRCLTGRDKKTICTENELTHHYPTITNREEVVEGVCAECQDVCVQCTQHGDIFGECFCKYFRVWELVNGSDEDKCVKECPENSYLVKNKTKKSYGVCQRCHSYCADHMGCSGPEALHCEQCKEAGIMDKGNMICLKECPPNKPYVYSKDRLCYNYDRDWTDAMKKKAFIAVSVFAIIAILIIIVCCGKILLKFRKKYKIEKNMHLPEIPEYDKNSIIKRPNMNQIRLISIDELVMPSPVQVLGEGAFGVVFAGKFKTQDKNGKKISLPVAIKAINVGNVVGGGSAHVKIGNTEAEMIEEAGIMAKLHHEHLLPLVGISFAKGVKIITPLRPLKSLNKFLQEHQHSLGARDLMVYCYQISSAMEYLARNKIVHCDLAARNVLMKRYNHVEVTDFGLARILEGANPTSTINNKIPVKWMPIECLANRKHTIYSEATDVWSFGVTCWEILVYGDMPYKLVTLPKGRDQAESLFQYLDNGGRLKQPSNCSQELYQLLLTCWATSPDSRPKFKSLKETLRQYNRAPHQFVLDRQLPQRMDSTADSEQHQRKLLEDLLRDSDFTNPVDDEITNYFNPTSMTNMTMETDLPPSPTSPSRPLIGTRHTRLSSTGTNSTRYKSEPGGKRQLSITTENGLLDEEITDEENYLVPKSGANDVDASSDEPDILYTPVIARTMDYANAEPPEDHDYLNAVTSEYYKPPPDYSPPRRLTNGSIPLEYVNTESSV